MRRKSVSGLRHRLRPLLGRRYFYGWAHRRANYVLAGSFTGFLAAQFGWKRYRWFYRRQQGRWGFGANFEGQYGPTLEDAEAHWREEVLRKYLAPVEAGPPLQGAQPGNGGQGWFGGFDSRPPRPHCSAHRTRTSPAPRASP